MPYDPLRIAVLISGGGRTALNLQKYIDEGKLNARIEKVVSSRTDAAGVQRAREVGLTVEVVERKALPDNAFQYDITSAVGDVDLVCMAGFLSLWCIPDSYRNRVMNIHPALLPDFGGKGMYGDRVHAAVLESRRSISGCTVHFCDNRYDHGPTILQRQVPVLPADTVESLAKRVFEQECIAYPQAVMLFSQGRLRVEAGQVMIR